MKDFHKFRAELNEAAMPRSVSGKVKYLEKLWAGVYSDFTKAGRNGTDFSINSDEVKEFMDDTKGRYPKIDWKRMSKQDKGLFDYAFEELWYYYDG